LHKGEDLTSPNRFWKLVGGVLDGLVAFHKSGLVHRDIACRNLFMRADKSVVLGDFGLSRSTKAKTSIYVQTDLETLLPWAWSAPESLLQREFSPKSDIWMFGVTVWEILTKGRQPHAELEDFSKFKEELRRGCMPLEILNCSGLPSRAESLLKLCFKFDIEQQDRKTEKPLASWNKHDIVNYIKTFSTNKNKQWNQCIQVILKEDIEYSLLEVSKEEELKDLGIPLLCARTLLRKLNLISKEESSRKVR